MRILLLSLLLLTGCARNKPKPAASADDAILDTYLKDWRKGKKL